MSTISYTNSTLKWRVGCTESLPILNLADEIATKYSIQFDDSLSKKPTTKGKFVGWDQTVIASPSDEQKLYSEEFASCVALAQQAWDSDKECITKVAFSHLWMFNKATQQKLDSAMEELGKASNKGEVRLYISGGYKNNVTSRQIVKYIENKAHQLSEDSSAKFTIVDNHFGIAEFAGTYLEHNHLCYSPSGGLLSAGFDANNQPYSIVDLRFNCFEGNLKDGKVVYPLTKL